MYLVSSCLAGICCRYDGNNNAHESVIELVNQGKAIPICPEQLGGLSTPRVCCELILDDQNNRKVISKDGHDLTQEFLEGSLKTLQIAQVLGIKKAILKSKSPSCGCGLIYDGTFSGNLIEGNGLTADLLIKNGIEVLSDNDLN
ncbi:MAG: DUF523 domain-containing protein [Turicibacter sp.]